MWQALTIMMLFDEFVCYRASMCLVMLPQTTLYGASSYTATKSIQTNDKRYKYHKMPYKRPCPNLSSGVSQ